LELIGRELALGLNSIAADFSRNRVTRRDASMPIYTHGRRFHCFYSVYLRSAAQFQPTSPLEVPV